MNIPFDKLAKRIAGALPSRQERHPRGADPPAHGEARFGFDELAKDLARGVSRREILSRLTGGAAGALLAALGIGKAWGHEDPNPGNGNDTCAHFCNSVYPPGPERGLCKSEGAEGRGPCGACGANLRRVCPLPGGGFTCCTAPDSCCGGVCRDLQTDSQHCGACGNACTSVQLCEAGHCVDQIPGCDPGLVFCNGQCRDLLTDEENCGVCGLGCPAGQLCCSGTCLNVSNDPLHCGTCNTVCAGGQTCCDGDCVNLGTASNCAGCGNMCAAGQDCCSQVCTDLNTVLNCGACGNVCVIANGTAVCMEGNCAVGACNPGFADCDGNAGNGCETNTATDVNNCGACGNVCSFANGFGACVNGACVLVACAAPFANCDGNPANGCEANTATDANNCGNCGTVCAGGRVCTNSNCVCPAGTQLTVQNNCQRCCPIPQPGQEIRLCCDANGGLGTTCQCTCVDVRSDELNCGFCGKNCFNEGSNVCCNGQCCGGGVSLCCNVDGVPVCIFNKTNNNDHCGECNNKCGPGQFCSNFGGGSGTSICCPTDPGWRNCGGTCYNTNTDPQHCGNACSNCFNQGSNCCNNGQCFRCPTGTTCVTGVCQPA